MMPISQWMFGLFTFIVANLSRPSVNFKDLKRRRDVGWFDSGDCRSPVALKNAGRGPFARKSLRHLAPEPVLR